MKRLLALALLGISSAFGVDSTLLNLVAPDARVISGMYVDRSVASPFGQFLLSQMNDDDAGFKRFVNITGFDPRRDVREAVFASLGVPSGKSTPGFVVARGVFNGPQIYAAAIAKGGTASRYKDVEIVQAKNGRSSVAVLDGSILLAGDEALVKTAIDRRTGGQPLDPKMLAKVQEVASRYDTWLVSSAPMSQFGGASPDKNVSGAMNSNALQGIEQTSGGVRFGSLIQIDGEAVTRSDKDAQSLVDVLKFLVGMVQMNSSKNVDVAKLAGFLNSMSVKTEANLVRVSFSVPQSDIEELIKSKKSVKRAAVR